jgi:hypothetical protein
MNYYYLAASLPALNMEVPPPMSGRAYRALCQEHLAAGDFRVLDEALTPGDEPPRSALGRQWWDQDRELRNAVVRIRAARLRTDPALFLREDALDTSCERAAADAFAKPNPRERELALDRFRWRQLDALAGYDPFSVRALVAYGLKLRLAERWAAMDASKGRQTIESIVSKDTTNQEIT